MNAHIAKEHAAFVIITPDMAQTLLRQNSKNRTVSMNRVKLYANSMRTGKWRTTHQGVAVFEDGILADGQHRLLAIVEANIPVRMLLVTGLQPDAVEGIDQHRSRSIADVARIAGHDWLNNRGVAVARLMFGMETATASDVLAIAEDVMPSVIFSKNCVSQNTKGLNAPAQAAVALAHFHGVDELVLSSYGQVLSTGIMEDNERQIAAFRLREWLGKNSSENSRGSQLRARCMRVTMRNITHYIQGTPISKVVAPDGYDFPLLSANKGAV